MLVLNVADYSMLFCLSVFGGGPSSIDVRSLLPLLNVSSAAIAVSGCCHAAIHDHRLTSPITICHLLFSSLFSTSQTSLEASGIITYSDAVLCPVSAYNFHAAILLVTLIRAVDRQIETKCTTLIVLAILSPKASVACRAENHRPWCRNRPGSHG